MTRPREELDAPNGGERRMIRLPTIVSTVSDAGSRVFRPESFIGCPGPPHRGPPDARVGNRRVRKSG